MSACVGQFSVVGCVFALLLVRPFVESARIKSVAESDLLEDSSSFADTTAATSAGSEIAKDYIEDDKEISDESVVSHEAMARNWWDLFCLAHPEMKNANGNDCKTNAQLKEEECKEWTTRLAAANGSVAYGIAYFESNGCDTFFSEMEDCTMKAQEQPPGLIARAAKACELQSSTVCKTASCPTFCRLNGMAQCNCDAMCDSTASQMWNTGSIECEKGESWSECMGKFTAKLAEDGRYHALEALTREHLLKCVCVSRLGEDSICYEGSLGIEPGKKWCDFNKTPSWRTLLESNHSSADWESVDWVHDPVCKTKEI